jgi:biotin transport system substrate-specific component
MQSNPTTLIAAAWPASERYNLVRMLLLAIAGSLVLTLSAKIQVPFWPVPMTMQTYAVMVIGAAFGWRLGGATVLLYLAEGAMGLPVFANTPERGIGLAYMMGPTGGYLLGFLVAAVVIGRLAERGWDRSLWKMIAAMGLGHVLVFAFGVPYLAMLTNWEVAVGHGLTPFVAASLLKTALAGATLPLAWKLMSRIRR